MGHKHVDGLMRHLISNNNTNWGMHLRMCT